jgi:hypothetical protein
MSILLFVLAVFGVLAILRRIALAGFLIMRRGVDRFMAGEVAEVHAQRGDLTRLSDASTARALARRAQWASAAVLSFWIALLIVPVLTPWPRLLYAACAALWLAPRRPTARR